MTSPTGATPPLHRRFNEQDALKLIRGRYAGLRSRISSQVSVLQKDGDFRQLCGSYYDAGYKDWLIISAVLNCMLTWKAHSRGLDLRFSEPREHLLELSEGLEDTCYPAWRFEKEEMDRMIATHNMTALVSYGFQPRRADFRAEVIERFLRERMNHFEFDLPHKPLFGEPPGDWPDV
jgi:hypothetical protein